MAFGNLRFRGIRVRNGEVIHKDGRGPVAGVSARVETSGDIDRRITATRLILTGPFALGLRKKKDSRELFVTVEGQGFAFVESVPPKEQAEARKFAAKLTAMGSAPQPAVPPPQAAPPQQIQPVAAQAAAPVGAWHPDPTGRHEQRWWDGTAWTENVVNAGLQSTDPLGVTEVDRAGDRNGVADDAPPAGSSVLQQLKDLAELRDAGILTDDEFAAQKAKILG